MSNTSFCEIFGCSEFTNFDPSNVTLGGAVSVVQWGASLIFVIIIIIGIFSIVRGSYKMINSEGDDAKIQEGFKVIRAVWIGIGLIFLGLIGIVVISAIFGGEGIFNLNPTPPADLNSII